jgi:LuxR family maltose regulon positive regulatory protein
MTEKQTKNVLIGTKYNKPETNPYLLSRLRLLRELDRALNCKLTLVTAPAGYGKTTAVIDWLGKCSLPYAWLSLDAKDNDPVTFWRYISTSLENITGGIIKDTEYVFSSQELMKANIHVNILIDRLLEVRSDFLLVLDDLHLISAPSILSGLSYLIDYLPAKMHLIVISRTLPEFELAKHRIKWQTQRLVEDDLRFNKEEISQFYLARGYSLPDDDVREVERYTEGWAAAMVVVAMSMEKDDRNNDAISALTRSGRDIDQYLRDEVIRLWPPERRSFAMKTSILDTLSEGVCEAVTGALGGRMLLEIYETGGFLTDMDGRRQVFRYHYLFRSFLCTLLRETDPEAIPGLYARAGAWFQEQDFIPEAVEHYLSGGCFDEACKIIEHRVDYMIDRKDFGMLFSWVDRLPACYRENSFKIAVIYAAYYAEIGSYDLSRQWIGRMKTLRETAQTASTPEQDAYSQTVCTMTEANLLIREGNMEFLPLILSAAESDRGRYYKMPEYSDLNTADIYFCRCPVRQLTALYSKDPEQYGRMTESYREMISKNPGYAPLGIGEYLYESNQLEAALPYLLKAVEEARDASCPGALVPAMVCLARVKRAEGDMSGAFNVLEECENQLQVIGKPHWIYLLYAFRCRLYIDTGSMDKVQEWFSSRKLSVFTELSSIREFELIVYAKVLILLGRAHDAQLLLERLFTFTGDNKRLHSRVEVLNILALLTFKKNNTRLAFGYLDESLDIGMNEGFVRSFLDELSPMVRLLRSYIKSRSKLPGDTKERRAFAGSLLKQMPDSLLRTLEARDEASREKTGKILDLLTAKEKQVLELMVNAATNQEIEDKLGISLRTVKTHTGNIYGKLGLKNRAQCVKFVRELGLF